MGNFVGIAFYVNLLSIIFYLLSTLSRKVGVLVFIRPISFFLFGYQIPGILRLAIAFSTCLAILILLGSLLKRLALS